MSRLHSAIIGLCATLAAFSFAQVAKADFASDAAAIIQQVIEDDIATQVIPNSAQSFPSTCDLIPASVYALQNKRINGFPRLVRKDVADTAGLLAFLKIEKGNLDALPGETLAPAVAVYLFRQQTLEILGALLDRTTLLNEQRHTRAAPPNGQVDCVFPPGAAAPGQSLPGSIMAACATAQGDARQELACSIALAVRDAANGDRGNLPADGQRALVALAAQNIEYLGGASRFSDALVLVNQAVANPPGPFQLSNGSPVAGALVAVLSAFGGEISALSKTPNEDLDRLLAIATTFASELASGHATTPDHPYDDLRDISTLAAGSFTIITAVRSKDYASAAGVAFDTLETVIEAKCKPNEPGCGHIDELVRKFLKAAAVYTIDSLENGNADGAASSDFRAAAVDLIEAAGGEGVRRKLFSTDPNSNQKPGWYFPNFALRGALRPGFAGRTEPGTHSSNLSAYPSMDWPNFRLKVYPPRRAGNPFWLGINLSPFDVIGPLYEVAARNPSLGDHQTRSTQAFLWGFVVPRVEVEFAIPELSKNLVAGIGGTVRMYRAVEQPITSATLPVTANYCFALQSRCDGGVFNGNNFEGSVFVKYVP